MLVQWGFTDLAFENRDASNCGAEERHAPWLYFVCAIEVDFSTVYGLSKVHVCLLVEHKNDHAILLDVDS